MPVRNIKIIDSNTETENLVFDRAESVHTRADAGDTIRWHIEKDSGVDAITSIVEKIESDKIWAVKPHKRRNEKTWEGVIKDSAKDPEIYLYLITWTRDGVEYTHDPLISIRPRVLHDILKVFFSSVCGVILGAAAFAIYWRTERTKLKRENETLKMNQK